MSFFHTFIRQLSTAIALCACCHTALAQSDLRLEMRNDNIARFYDGSTVVWSGTLPNQMPISCLQIALERQGATIVCPPHISRRLGLRFEMPALMPVKENWEWQSYSARITRDGPSITLLGATYGVEAHFALSILFWIVVLTVLWGVGRYSLSVRNPPDRHR